MPNPVTSPAEVVRCAERRHARSPAADTVLRQVSDPTVRLVEISATVHQDPTLAARLLQQANSPLFGVRRQVSELGTAVRMLGLRGTREAVLAAVLAAMAEDLGEVGLHIFERSCRSVQLGRALAAAAPGLTAGEAATACLLQDLGVLMLLFADHRTAPRLAAAADDAELVQLEQQQLGFTHADVGACALLRWGMPTDLVRAVESHHRPMATGRLGGLVQLTGQLLATLERLGPDVDELLAAMDPERLQAVFVVDRLRSVLASEAPALAARPMTAV